MASGQIIIGPPVAAPSLSRSVSPSTSPALSATPLAALPSPVGSSSSVDAQVGTSPSSGSAGNGSSNSLVLVAIVISVVVLLLLIAAVIFVVLWRRRREAAREKLRGSGAAGETPDSTLVSVSNRMYGSGGDDDVSTEKGRAAVAAFKAARLAAARAEQEAAAAAPMDVASDGGTPSRGRRPSRGTHRGKVVVVKAIFGPQEAIGSGAGSDGGRVTAKLEVSKGVGTQPATLAMLRQPRGGTSSGGFVAVNLLLAPRNQAAPVPPPPPPANLMSDHSGPSEGEAAFECDSPLRMARGPGSICIAR